MWKEFDDLIDGMIIDLQRNIFEIYSWINTENLYM